MCAAPTIVAIRYRQRVAIIDQRGTLTFDEFDARPNAIANHWRRHGMQAGDRAAVLVYDEDYRATVSNVVLRQRIWRTWRRHTRR